MTVANEDILNLDYAGAKLIAPTTLRCGAEAVPSSREFIGVPFQWRRRQVAGGGSSPVQKNVGGETSMNGIAPGSGLAANVWLADPAGIGLGGSAAVSTIDSITMEWRGQKNIQDMDYMYLYAKVAQEKRGSPISNGVGAALADFANWPATMSSTLGENRPSKDPEQMLLPMVLPGRMLHTSKVQRVLGDLQTDFVSTPAFTNAHEFMSWELLEFNDDQLDSMAVLGLFQGEPERKNLTGTPGKESNFRYTAVEFQ